MLRLELGTRPIHGGFRDGVEIISGHQSGDCFVVISANGMCSELAQARGDFIGVGPVTYDVAEAHGDVPAVLHGIKDGIQRSGV